MGACILPMTDRSYSSSPSMYVLRSYNGQLYEGGKTTKTVAKVHPGNVIKFTLDMDVGTLSFSIDGSAPEIAFEKLKGTFYPCAGHI